MREKTDWEMLNTPMDAPLRYKEMLDVKERQALSENLDGLLASWKAAQEKRSQDMPTDETALNVMFDAWQRLKEMGWQEAIYCPKDGSMFFCIEAGSTGIHHCSYDGEWPKGGWWVHEHGDMWPSHPILWKPIEKKGMTA